MLFRSAKEGKTYLTNPYPDAGTGDYCYTLSVALEDGETVVAIDVLLTSSEEYIHRMAGDENSKAMIITGDGLIVGCNDSAYAGKTMAVGFPEYTSALEQIKKTSKTNGPDHLTCLLRNLYADQEATVRTGHGTTDWFQIGKGDRKSVV